MQNTTQVDTDKDIVKKVYEIGYVLVSSIPQEKVADETLAIKDTLAKAGAEIIAEENPEHTALAYTMIKKINGANHRFDEGYFGWVKFTLASDAIVGVKKSFDSNMNILRYLLMTTVKENTYLGKRAPVHEAVIRDQGMIAPESVETVAAVANTNPEEIDKSIEAMVKGA